MDGSPSTCVGILIEYGYDVTMMFTQDNDTSCDNQDGGHLVIIDTACVDGAISAFNYSAIRSSDSTIGSTINESISAIGCTMCGHMDIDVYLDVSQCKADGCSGHEPA